MAESSPDSTSLFSFTNLAEAHACPEENGVPDVAQDDVAEEGQQDGRDKPSLKVSVESEKHYERFFSSRSRFETPDQERAALYRVFSTFDENQDGRISMEEMKKSFNKLGIALSDEALVESLSSVAVAEEGSVDFDGFCSLYRSMCQELSPPGGSRGDASLTAAFKVFDKNGDGLISALELQSVLHSLGISEGRDLADFEEMIRKVDSNGDGQLKSGTIFGAVLARSVAVDLFHRFQGNLGAVVEYFAGASLDQVPSPGYSAARDAGFGKKAV